MKRRPHDNSGLFQVFGGCANRHLPENSSIFRSECVAHRDAYARRTGTLLSLKHMLTIERKVGESELASFEAASYACLLTNVRYPVGYGTRRVCIIEIKFVIMKLRSSRAYQNSRQLAERLAHLC